MKIIKKVQYNAPVILTFALISLAVLILDYLTSGSANRNWFSVYRAPLTDPRTYIRFITYSLGHANAQHYFNNFLLILLVGPLLEERYGGKRLIMMMVVTTLITGVIFVMFNPTAAGLGASGVAFMLILLASVTNAQKGRLPMTLIFALVFYVGSEILREVGPDESSISHISHIVGGLCGAAFGMYLGRRK